MLSDKIRTKYICGGRYLYIAILYFFGLLCFLCYMEQVF